jgi:hypothetical protein
MLLSATMWLNILLRVRIFNYYNYFYDNINLICMNYVNHFWNYVTTWTLATITFTHIKYIINLKHPNMKKTIFFALLTIFSLSALPTFAAKNSPKTTETTETTETTVKLTEEEISAYRARVEEIRDMDKSELTASEKKELKNELKEIKKTMHKDGTYLYVGGSTVLLIIIILLLI